MTRNDCQQTSPVSLKKRVARAFFWYGVDISIALVGFTYGFGLEVKNWPALLGTFICARFITHMLSVSFARDDAAAISAAPTYPSLPARMPPPPMRGQIPPKSPPPPASKAKQDLDRTLKCKHPSWSRHLLDQTLVVSRCTACGLLLEGKKP